MASEKYNSSPKSRPQATSIGARPKGVGLETLRGFKDALEAATPATIVWHKERQLLTEGLKRIVSPQEKAAPDKTLKEDEKTWAPIKTAWEMNFQPIVSNYSDYVNRLIGSKKELQFLQPLKERTAICNIIALTMLEHLYIAKAAKEKTTQAEQVTEVSASNGTGPTEQGISAAQFTEIFAAGITDYLSRIIKHHHDLQESDTENVLVFEPLNPNKKERGVVYSTINWRACDKDTAYTLSKMDSSTLLTEKLLLALCQANLLAQFDKSEDKKPLTIQWSERNSDEHSSFIPLLRTWLATGKKPGKKSETGLGTIQLPGPLLSGVPVSASSSSTADTLSPRSNSAPVAVSSAPTSDPVSPRAHSAPITVATPPAEGSATPQPRRVAPLPPSSAAKKGPIPALIDSAQRTRGGSAPILPVSTTPASSSTNTRGDTPPPIAPKPPAKRVGAGSIGKRPVGITPPATPSPAPSSEEVRPANTAPADQPVTARSLPATPPAGTPKKWAGAFATQSTSETIAALAKKAAPSTDAAKYVGVVNIGTYAKQPVGTTPPATPSAAPSSEAARPTNAAPADQPVTARSLPATPPAGAPKKWSGIPTAKPKGIPAPAPAKQWTAKTSAPNTGSSIVPPGY